MKRYNAVVGGVYDPSVMVEEKDGDYVWYEDVEERIKMLEAYINAFDCINDAMGFAHRAIADPDSIAMVDLPTESQEPDADKSLIAAAPELLEALEALQPYVLHLPDGAPIKETIRAAIAKAKGVQP